MTILLVEDTMLLAKIYMEYLQQEKVNIVHVSTGKEAISFLSEHSPEIVLLDVVLPDMDGMEILEYISKAEMNCCSIVITAYGAVSRVVDAMRLGAFDYLQKPIDKSRLVFTVRNAVERMQLLREVDTYKNHFGRREYHGMIGSSGVMQVVYNTIENVASSSATVFITGESGTGKELCAEAIHDLSGRKNKELVILNCGAIPRDLMESEIFGHVKGSFTGAVTDREGAAQRANGGTLFLDEICEMDIDLQSKLLRVIQSGTFQRVGSSKTITVDIRFICATNRDPLEMVKKGLFREDLYYRLNVIPINMPSLRDRGQDKLEVAEALLKKYSAEEGKAFKGYSPRVEEIILQHPWPGNVRQLQNIIRNIVVLHDGEIVRQNMLPKGFIENIPTDLKNNEVIFANDTDRQARPVNKRSVRSIRPLWQYEKEIIEEAIEICGGSISRAAGYLNINPATIYRKKKIWQIEASDNRDKP